MAETVNDSAGMVAVHSQLGKIEGILSTIVTEHARRITDQEGVSRQLRIDLTAVNMDLNSKVGAVDTRVVTNTANILELKGDVQETKDKQNAALPRTAQIMSPLIAVGSLIWAVIVGAK